jgi:hypothetical protein
MRETVKVGSGFSSLMKQKKKGKIYFVIYIAGFFCEKKMGYEVIVKRFFKERPRLYYWGGWVLLLILASNLGSS